MWVLVQYRDMSTLGVEVTTSVFGVDGFPYNLVIGQHMRGRQMQQLLGVTVVSIILAWS